MPDTRLFSHLEAIGAITPGIKDRITMPVAGEVINVSGALGVASAGAALVYEIQRNGVTMFSTVPNKPTLAIAALSNVSVRPDTGVFAAGDVLAVNVVSVGTAATDLDVTVQFVTN